jgi:hypothetical protein
MPPYAYNIRKTLSTISSLAYRRFRQICAINLEHWSMLSIGFAFIWVADLFTRSAIDTVPRVELEETRREFQNLRESFVMFCILLEMKRKNVFVRGVRG